MMLLELREPGSQALDLVSQASEFREPLKWQILLLRQ